MKLRRRTSLSLVARARIIATICVVAVGPGLVRQRLETYITAVVTHFRGQVYACEK